MRGEKAALPPVRLMTLSVHAGEVFANQEKALHWLQSQLFHLFTDWSIVSL
jgi:hypothetical protein